LELTARNRIGSSVDRRLGAIGLCVAAWLLLGASAWAQAVPAPSQVTPPVIVPPTGGGHIAIPEVPAGAQVPEQAKKLSFKLLGFDLQGGFEELAAPYKEIAAALVGRRVTVADIFVFADKLQQIYVKAGYPLVRVVIPSQEFEGSARIKLRVIDGFVERMDLETLAVQVRGRVAAVLAPLQRQTHLKQTELERRLLIAGEAPGLVLNATFAAGKEVGGSVLVLTGRYRKISASLYIDNDMPKVFGTGQAVVTASLNSLFGLGEQFTASVAGLPDTDFVTPYPTRRYLSGSGFIPLGFDGWKFEFGGTDGVTTPRVDPSAATRGVYTEGYAKISYEALKARDYELTLNERLDAANEEIQTLLVTPPAALSSDRVRALRSGIDGIWRLREDGTTISFGGNYSRGLDALGARTAADATALLPLSRQGADAVFDKLDGHIDINQSLPENFVATFSAGGQYSFHHAMLTSEMYDIDGAKLLSGFTAGSLPGDTAWVVRGELGRPFTVPIQSAALTITPYLFVADGERILEDPTALEIASVHALNYGIGSRFNLPPWLAEMPSAYAFVEWSHRQTNEAVLNGDRIFCGLLLQY
jgi:hemolysin activation/secretion protein